MRSEPAARVRLGLLRLTDAAPVFLAEAAGLFAEEGADVRLSVEPSWANVADKLAFGLLDAAVLLPPLAIAMDAGLRRPAAPLLVPMSLSLNGNSVVLGRDLADAALGEGDGGEEGGRLGALGIGRRLRDHLRSRPRPRPRLAVVHAWSTHDLLLRYWLAACGLEPGRDVDLTVVPPAEAADALAARRIEGFCAGAPWGAVAAAAGLGRTVVRSSAIWRNHPEKCLAVRADWAAREPEALQAMLRALLRAGARCDGAAAEEEEGGAGALAALLAEPSRVGVPAGLVAASLPGAGGKGEEDAAEGDRSVFAAHAAAFPWRSHARWFATQMARWRPGEVLSARVAARAERLYRPDLYAEAARELGLPVPLADRKPEGGHEGAWELAAEPRPIAMLADTFCDGRRFDP